MNAIVNRSQTAAPLPLFPDLLDRHDFIGRNSGHLRRGHGVWSVGDSLSRNRGEDCSEMRCVVVIYDDGRFWADKVGPRWTVEIRHYRHFSEEVTRGWGSSRTKSSERRMRYHDTERRFATRDEAVDFAEKILVVCDRVRSRRND